MRIGLISDTHIPEVVKALPPQLNHVFRNVDLILHAGDVYTVAVLDELERLAPTWAASGDDDGSLINSDRRMEEKQFLSVDGKSILVKHQGPWFPSPGLKEVPGRAGYHHRLGEHQEAEPDIIVCGHTHTARVEDRNGILVVNPGSATFPEYKLQLGTVALLTISSGEAEVHLVQLQ